MTHRRALSRGELFVGLVCVVLAGVLVATAITRLREIAARTKCQNNLKQLVFGAQNYGGTALKLPPLTDQGSEAKTGTGLPSVFASLIPFLECTGSTYYPGAPAERYHAHSSVVFELRGKEGEIYFQYGGQANQVWRLFTDEVDPTSQQLRDVPVVLPGGTTGYYATGSYAANGQLPWGQKVLTPPLGEWPTTAIVFTERPQVCRTESGESVYNLWGVGFYSPHMPAFATLTPTDPPGLWSTDQIAPTADGQFRIGRVDAVPQLVANASPFQLIRQGQPCDPGRPGTPHREGLPAAMSDGSVRLFTLETDPWVFWSASLPPSFDPPGR